MNRDLNKLLAAINRAVTAVHEDPKNVAKGNYPEDLIQLIRYAKNEVNELIYEIIAPETDYDRIISEAGDCINFLGMIVLEAEKRKLG